MSGSSSSDNASVISPLPLVEWTGMACHRQTTCESDKDGASSASSHSVSVLILGSSCLTSVRRGLYMSITSRSLEISDAIPQASIQDYYSPNSIQDKGPHLPGVVLQYLRTLVFLYSPNDVQGFSLAVSLARASVPTLSGILHYKFVFPARVDLMHRYNKKMIETAPRQLESPCFITYAWTRDVWIQAMPAGIWGLFSCHRLFVHYWLQRMSACYNRHMAHVLGAWSKGLIAFFWSQQSQL